VTDIMTSITVRQEEL